MDFSVIQKLGTSEGKPVVKPTPQSCAPPCDAGSLVLHTVARSHKGTWNEFPVESWTVLGPTEAGKLLPGRDVVVGTAWELDKDVTAKFLTGFVPSYSALVGTRAIMALGSSAQHPVAASLLSGYFPRNRGTILALNSSLANVGALLAPLSVSLLLLAVGWRQLFIMVAIATMVMGVAYFFFRDRSGAGGAGTASRKARLAEGRASYGRVLRNRNMMVISLIMMVGAAASWGLGSFASQRLPLPADGLATTGWQMLFGGLVLTVAGALGGEHVGTPSGESAWAWAMAEPASTMRQNARATER